MNVDGEDELDRATEALDDAGAVDIEERVDTWRAEGWQPSAQTGAALSSPSPTGRTQMDAFTAMPSDTRLGGTRTGNVGALRVFDRQSDVGSSTLSQDTNYDQHAQAYRDDFQNRYGLTGTFDEYEPAYRFGHGLRSEDRYAGRHWEDIEPDVRSDWEAKNPGSAWERSKDAVRHAWDKVTG